MPSLWLITARISLILTIVTLPAIGRGQSLTNVVVTVLPAASPSHVGITLQSASARADWSFRNTYGPAIGLGARISNFAAADSNGKEIAVQNLAAGEFRTAEKVSHLTYEVNLTQPSRAGDMSHVSWLTGERGLLMFADLLPISEDGKLEVELKLPEGWQASSSLKKEGSRYSANRVDQAIFLIAPSIKQQRKRVGSTQFSVSMIGNWPVSVGDVAKLAGKMVEEYSKLTGYEIHDDPMVMLVPFPGNVGAERWTAETRGNSLVLLLGNNASRQQILGRLGVIFTHEVFHFWVPNSLQLGGDYDWFFEGFTIYLALKTALRTGLIDFDEYLATLARVYDSYMLTLDRDRLSLIELSERRWTSASSLVYDKGMLVALIYDLQSTMTRGNSGFEPVYQELFRFATTSSRDGNEVIISLLDRLSGVNSFSQQFVTRATPIDLESSLAPYGIRIERQGFQTALQIDKNINDQQRRLLRLLGYRE